ncbi:MAG: hypothetical protein ACLP29_02060 [Dissulfurispiraceae bacterium]
MSDVWILESEEEQAFSAYLSLVCDKAMKGSRKARKLLSELWDGEDWVSIKEKLDNYPALKGRGFTQPQESILCNEELGQ